MQTKKRVLIIEDHDDSRRALATILRRQGTFEVIDYECCAPAEHHLHACDIDIALLDVRMPGRCGDDFGRELCQRCPKTMIVFVTGESIVEPLKEAVPDCFVMRKPIDAQLLLELLDCFGSKEGYASEMSNEMAEKAGPGSM